MKIKASEFVDREMLEGYITATHGRDEVANRAAGISIEGTKEDMARLFLSNTTTVFGIVCKVIS